MQHYGLILADNGSNWYFGGTADSSWPLSLVDELKRVPASAFDAVDESSLMVSADSGQVRTAAPAPPPPAPAPPATPTTAAPRPSSTTTTLPASTTTAVSTSVPPAAPGSGRRAHVTTRTLARVPAARGAGWGWLALGLAGVALVATGALVVTRLRRRRLAPAQQPD